MDSIDNIAKFGNLFSNGDRDRDCNFRDRSHALPILLIELIKRGFQSAVFNGIQKDGAKSGFLLNNSNKALES